MYPKVNDVLFIQLPSEGEKEAHFEYRSRIAETEENDIYMEVPIHEGSGHLKKLHMGDELSIYFITEGGVKHFFNTYVTGFKEDVIRMVKIRRPSLEEIFQVQRRNFLRVQAKLELAVKFQHDFTRFVTYTENVGGGGVSFLGDVKHAVQEGQVLSCWLLIHYKNGEMEHVPFEGVVVRSITLESGRKKAMVEFTQITDMERQKIIKYCFERQLDFRGR
ncbi:flagellar brake domain-containing protein [Paenibacillus sp. Marseille-Q4541]|uniref:flagellar brake protein n=1 Tax=Paenibacillus sp. Marseille-Q4541 TaxID=2831522 RepID=UPI001BAB445A|nr:flagellar brake domain-containing protein [Paenibacillus sp. Marseille-Q4541]